MDQAKETAGRADKVKQIEILGEPAWELNSERLTCIVFPGHGGKVLSLKSRETGFELLFQNPGKGFKKAEPGSPFEEFEACGFDDAFPSIDPGCVTAGGREVVYPDHGEIWSASFDCRADEEGLCLNYRSKILPYRYEKRLSLRGDTLHCSYRIENLGRYDFPCIWACLLPGCLYAGYAAGISVGDEGNRGGASFGAPGPCRNRSPIFYPAGTGRPGLYPRAGSRDGRNGEILCAGKGKGGKMRIYLSLGGDGGRPSVR